MKKNITGGILHLIITGVIGFVFFIIGQLLYPTLTEILWQPLGIAIYFLIFACIEYLAMFVLNQVRRDYSYYKTHNKMDDLTGAYKRGAVCLLVIFLLTGVFEFLYELGGDTPGAPSSYIFLIDDSGSMQGNDPQQKRKDAIYSIMSGQTGNIPYAVYGFTDSAVLLKDISLYSSADEFTFNSYGGTDIVNSLNKVLNDINDGTLNAGSSPRILILSDGESFSWGWKNAVRRANSKNVIISSIGFGYSSNLLRNIAEKTGGVFIQVDDVNDLRLQMETAISSYASRNLISSRVVTHLGALYAILRVVFLILIGLVWSWMKLETYCSAEDKAPDAKNKNIDEKVFKLSILFCSISALLMELLLQVTDAPPSLVRMIFCVLWAVTPGFFVVDRKSDFVPPKFDPVPSPIPDDPTPEGKNNNEEYDKVIGERGTGQSPIQGGWYKDPSEQLDDWGTEQPFSFDSFNAFGGGGFDSGDDFGPMPLGGGWSDPDDNDDANVW